MVRAVLSGCCGREIKAEMSVKWAAVSAGSCFYGVLVAKGSPTPDIQQIIMGLQHVAEGCTGRRLEGPMRRMMATCTLS